MKIKKAVMKKFNTFSLQSVDIIIPFHAAYGKVTKAVESILLYTNHPYKITLVDDCSPNKNFADNLLKLNEIATNVHRVEDKLKKMDTISVIRNEKQLGFGASLNAGIKNTNFPWIVFMHSDCACETQGWLEQLGHSLVALHPKNVKMVSVKSDNPGDYPEILKRPKIIPKDSDVSDFRLNGNVVRDSVYLPLIGAMCHRELFNKIGLFKEYPYVWYEDLEFAFRMRHHGYYQGVSGRSWLHHEGGATVNNLFERRNLQEIMNENRERCISDIKELKKTVVGVNTVD